MVVAIDDESAKYFYSGSLEVLLHSIRKRCQKTSHLDFRRDIVLVLMKSFSSRRQTRGSRHADLPTEMRYDGQNHKPVPCT